MATTLQEYVKERTRRMTTIDDFCHLLLRIRNRDVGLVVAEAVLWPLCEEFVDFCVDAATRWSEFTRSPHALQWQSYVLASFVYAVDMGLFMFPGGGESVDLTETNGALGFAIDVETRWPLLSEYIRQKAKAIEAFKRMEKTMERVQGYKDAKERQRKARAAWRKHCWCECVD